MRVRPRLAAVLCLGIFLLPPAARGALTAFEDRPTSWHDADWSSTGMLPAASDDTDARILVMSGRTGRWKGILAVHSWIVLKAENAPSWRRFDVVGWGSPIRTNGWAPDGRWFGDRPFVVADIRGAQAASIIPKIEAAIASYPFADAGAYRIWPGPNSNTFVATVLRSVPELAVALPPNAIGKDYRPGAFLGPTDSGTGVEINLWGLVGAKVGWVEGIELNFLTLVAGLDLRRPAIKLPGFGRIGIDAVARASSASS